MYICGTNHSLTFKQLKTKTVLVFRRRQNRYQESNRVEPVFVETVRAAIIGGNVGGNRAISEYMSLILEPVAKGMEGMEMNYTG